MKKLVILVIVGTLVTVGADSLAQEILIPSPAGDPGGFPPQMELPEVPAVGSGTRTEPTDSVLTPDPSPEPIASGDLQPELEPYVSDGDVRIFGYQPALLESTGTWLRRGFWYTEVDAVLMDRVWQRDGFTLAFQQLPAGAQERRTLNQMILDGGATGAEAAPRLKIGRFLFRDYKNRDHAAEFIAYGGGQWTTTGRLDAVPGGTLQVGFGGVSETALNVGNGLLFNGRLVNPIDNGNISFDGASSMQYEYNSRFNNFELNYHVKNRMRKDRMELEPSGHWVRRAQSGGSWSLLAGLRYLNINEDLDWDAFGIDDDNNAATAAQTGNYRIDTDNDLIGTQLGGSWTYESARWSLGLKHKGGIYLNHTDVNSNFFVTGGVTEGRNDITVDNLSFITEGALTGKWHLRPNFSLRAGLDIMYVSSIALAPEQINFIPVQTSQTVGHGSVTYMGGSIGFESYW